MADEQPVTIKKREVTDSHRKSAVCVVHYSKDTTDRQIRPLSECSFRTIQNCKLVRQQQENEALRLDSICKNVPLEFDAATQGSPMVLHKLHKCIQVGEEM